MPAPNKASVSQLARGVAPQAARGRVESRIDANFAADPLLLPGAVCHGHGDVAGLARRLRGRACLRSCQGGRTIGQGAAAWSRTKGFAWEAVAGGYGGWRDRGRPVIGSVALAPPEAEGCLVWVSRQGPKIDRLACSWLIRRFADRAARFVVVLAEDWALVAETVWVHPVDVAGLGAYDAPMARALNAADETHHWRTEQGGGAE